VKGQKISLGYTFAQSFWVGAGSTFASLQLFAPSGSQMNLPSIQIITLPETGLYSVEITATTGFAVPYKLRVNSVVDASPLTLLEPITELNLTLALGEHKRFALTPSLSQGEVLAVRIAITPTSHVGAVVNDGSIFNICGVGIEGQYPFNGENSTISGACYVTSSGTYNLEVFSINRYTERIGGSITIGILKPTPQPIGFDTLLSGNLEPRQMLSYRLNVTNQARYLLRGTFVDSFSMTAIVWGPSAPFQNYKGDLIVTDDTEQDRVLRVGANTLTILNRNPDNPKPYNVSIVTLEPPLEITVDAAPLNGVIDIAGEKDYYRFNATAGQNFTITASSASLVGTIRVYPLPAQNEFTAGANITPFNPPKTLGNYNFITPTTGTYAIEIDGSSAATGAYTLALTSP
jgi:hypothetical protein